MNEWQRTDDFQLVQKIDGNTFNVIEPTFFLTKEDKNIVLLHQIET